MIRGKGVKLKYFALALSLIAIAAGVWITFFQSRGFVKTTATITAIEREEDTTADDDAYIVTVDYDADGTHYSRTLDAYSPSYKVGKTVTVLYDPNDPGVVHSGVGFGIYFLVVGVAIFAFVIFSIVRDKQSQKQVAALREASGQTGYAPSVLGDERELYFLTDLGTPKYGHRLEDRARRVLYEAKMTKFTITQPFGFDFIDHEHGVAAPHLVGHSESNEIDSMLIDNFYTFELDGVDIWKHLKQNGISVDSRFDSGNGRLLGTSYRILRYGVEIARAESTSQYPHEEDADRHKAASAVPVQGFYRVWTREQNLDLLFVTLLAFARSGATDDKGGNYGTVRNTLKRN